MCFGADLRSGVHEDSFFSQTPKRLKILKKYEPLGTGSVILLPVPSNFVKAGYWHTYSAFRPRHTFLAFLYFLWLIGKEESEEFTKIYKNVE